MSDNLDAATTWARGLIARWPGEPAARYLTALVNAADPAEPEHRKRLDVYVRAKNVMREGLRTEEIGDGVMVDYWTDRDGNEHVAGVEVLQARGVDVDGQARWDALHHSAHLVDEEGHTAPVEWRPMCGSGRIWCLCMEPNLGGPCDEFKACGSPRCGECGWPPYRHKTTGVSS